MKLLIHVIIKINRHLLGTDCFDFSEIFSRKYVQHILTKMPDKWYLFSFCSGGIIKFGNYSKQD